MILSYSAHLAGLKEFISELDDSFPLQQLPIILLITRRIFADSLYFLNNSEAFTYKGKATRENSISELHGLIEEIFLKMTTFWRGTAAPWPGCYVTRQELATIIAQTPMKREEANKYSFHELHFFIAKGAYAIEIKKTDEKKIDLNDKMIETYRKKLSDKVDYILLCSKKSWNIIDTKRVVVALRDPSQDDESIESFFSQKSLSNAIDTSTIQLIHEAGINSVKLLLDWLHSNRDTALFLESLKKFAAKVGIKNETPHQSNEKKAETVTEAEDSEEQPLSAPLPRRAFLTSLLKALSTV